MNRYDLKPRPRMAWPEMGRIYVSKQDSSIVASIRELKYFSAHIHVDAVVNIPTGKVFTAGLSQSRSISPHHNHNMGMT